MTPEPRCYFCRSRLDLKTTLLSYGGRTKRHSERRVIHFRTAELCWRCLQNDILLAATCEQILKG